MGKYLEDRELDSVLEAYFNEGIKDIFKKKNNKKDEKSNNENDEKIWSDDKIRKYCNELKEWLKNPENISENKASHIFTIAIIVNILPMIKNKMKLISDPKNECNWQDAKNDRNAYDTPSMNGEDYTFEDLGLTKFPEAKEKKMLLYVFPASDFKDFETYMSKKSGKAINYDYKNRYTIKDITDYIGYFDRRDYGETIDENKVKEIWNETK